MLILAIMFMGLSGLEQYSFDELNVSRLGSTAFCKTEVLLSFYSINRNQRTIAHRLGIYDFKTDYVRILEHPALKQTRTPTAISIDEKFILIEDLNKYSPIVFHIEDGGKKVRIQKMANFDGWNSRTYLSYISKGINKTALVTIVNEKQEKILLGEVDFNKESIKVIHQENWLPEQERYWFSDGREIIFCNSMTGELINVDRQGFKAKKTFSVKKPIIEAPRKGKIEKWLGFAKNERYLGLPREAGGFISFREYFKYDHQGKQLDEPWSRTLQIDPGGKLGHHQKTLLGLYEDSALFYNHEHQVLTREQAENFKPKTP